MRQLDKNEPVDEEEYKINGFRMHHSYLDDSGRMESFLSYCLRNDLTKCLRGPSFTVSDKSLKEVNNGIPNYEVVLKDRNLLVRLRESCGDDFGFFIADPEIVDFFLELESKADPRDEYIYKSARDIFVIDEPPKRR